jgi:hypothetical protein
MMRRVARSHAGLAPRKRRSAQLDAVAALPADDLNGPVPGVALPGASSVAALAAALADTIRIITYRPHEGGRRSSGGVCGSTTIFSVICLVWVVNGEGCSGRWARSREDDVGRGGSLPS